MVLHGHPVCSYDSYVRLLLGIMTDAEMYCQCKYMGIAYTFAFENKLWCRTKWTNNQLAVVCRLHLIGLGLPTQVAQVWKCWFSTFLHGMVASECALAPSNFLSGAATVVIDSLCGKSQSSSMSHFTALPIDRWYGPGRLVNGWDGIEYPVVMYYFTVYMALNWSVTGRFRKHCIVVEALLHQHTVLSPILNQLWIYCSSVSRQPHG